MAMVSFQVHERLFESGPVPTTADLGDILEKAGELGVDPEEGYDDEPRKTDSVVDASYKQQYKENGHPDNNGDWLSQTLDAKLPKIAVGKKLVTDVEAYAALCDANGVNTEYYKFGDQYHMKAERRNGWEGRFAMSARNVLRKRVADAQQLIVQNEILMPQPRSSRSTGLSQ